MSAIDKPDSLTIRKLAIAKQLATKANLVAGEPGLLGPSLGIALSQDAIEMSLRAAAEHHHINLPGFVNFDDLIKTLEKHKITVPHQQRIGQINRLRANFKHLGVLVESAQARELISFTRTILDSIGASCLQFSIWDVTSVDLIHKTRIRNRMTLAMTALSDGRHEECCTESAIAFALVFGSVTRGPRTGGSAAANIEDLVNRQRNTNKPIGALEVANAAVEDIGELSGMVNAVSQDLQFLDLGISVNDLRRFRSLVPAVNGGKWSSQLVEAKYQTPPKLNEENAAFVFDFALDSILRAPRLRPLPMEPTTEMRVVCSTPVYADPKRVEVLTNLTEGHALKTHPFSRPDQGLLAVYFEDEPAYVPAENVVANEDREFKTDP